MNDNRDTEIELVDIRRCSSLFETFSIEEPYGEAVSFPRSSYRSKDCAGTNILTACVAAADLLQQRD